ncbi:MAG: CapA family protein, partial [Lachnospiraceae bacterium]|nr:CapA family protein [Lachnospiraceae bacterium]
MKVILAGDFCDSARVSGIIERNQYETLFASVRDIIKSVDFSFVNFEFPVVAKEGKPIPKCGPNLKGQPKAVDAIKYAGFNCCTLANNHILDQGEECLKDTKSRIEAVGIKTVGAGSNLTEASEILYLHKDGQKLAVINCCEHEFTIAMDTRAGANPLNPIQQFYKIQEARQNADYVLVIVHGGHEHYQLPSPRMKETYRFFVDAGADAVVNHHQ